MPILDARSATFAAIVLALTGAAHAAKPAAARATPPRLVLQITVDQLRGDLPERFLAKMGQGGWRWLLDHGLWYGDAHHGHANTETIVGHATLATGADPSVNGMVGNVWLDRATGKPVYNIEDPAYRILTPGSSVDRASEVDPTQKIASTDGRSPNAILGSTFSDELALRTHGRAKIFGVSVKDRGAVSMAGHAGKAFWFSKASGEFVTSSYYYDRYPEWVDRWNAAKLPARDGRCGVRDLVDRDQGGPPSRHAGAPCRAPQLPPAAIGRGVRGVRPATFRERLRRRHGHVEPRLAVALRHVGAGGLRGRCDQGTARRAAHRDGRGGADALGGGGRRAAVGLAERAARRSRASLGAQIEVRGLVESRRSSC
jgi:hypothetical protein